MRQRLALLLLLAVLVAELGYAYMSSWRFSSFAGGYIYQVTCDAEFSSYAQNGRLSLHNNGELYLTYHLNHLTPKTDKVSATLIINGTNAIPAEASLVGDWSGDSGIPLRSYTRLQIGDKTQTLQSYLSQLEQSETLTIQFENHRISLQNPRLGPVLAKLEECMNNRIKED